MMQNQLPALGLGEYLMGDIMDEGNQFLGGIGVGQALVGSVMEDPPKSGSIINKGA